MNNKIQNLGKIVNIQSSTRIFEKEYVQDGIPFYRSKEVIEKHNGNSVSTQLFISEERFNKIKQTYTVPQQGDILLTSVGTIGVPYIVKENEQFYFKDGNLTWFNNFSKEIDNKYLYYWFLSESGREALNSILIGTTQKALTIKDLKSLKLSLPPLPEQKRISNILSSFDNKIELLRKENNTLEDIAQSIFKEWFVKYNFPNKDGKPYRDNNGKMIDSELGLIPEGWRVGKLGEVSTVTSGKGLPKGDLDPKGAYEVLGANGVIGKTNMKLFDKALIYTGRVGTLGNVFLSEGPAWFSDNTLLIFPKEHCFYYIYRCLQRQKLKNLDRGSTQPLITQTDIKNISLINPPNGLLKLFDEKSSIIGKKIKRNKTILSKTEKIKTALLNKLIKA